MKTAAKVFMIIGMVCGFWCVLPLVFGIIGIKKLNNGEMTTGWKVVTLIFVSLVGGILLLCMKNEPAAEEAPAEEVAAAE